MQLSGNDVYPVNESCARWCVPASGLSAHALLLCLLAVLLSSAAARAQVTFAGTQISVAGSALASPSGVAVDGQGNIFIADRGNNRVLSVAPSGNGFAAPAVILSGLSEPSGVTSDWAGNVYVADTGNNRILLLPKTKAGFGAATALGSGLSSPSSVAVDPQGNLFVADTGNNRVVELPLTGSAYGSPVTISNGLSTPMAVAVDRSRTLYIADTGNNRILKIPFLSGGYSTPQVLNYHFNAPQGLYVDKSYNIYIADTGNSRVVEEQWAAAANRYAAQVVIGSNFSSPQAVAVDASGNVYVADVAENRAMVVEAGSVNFGSVNVGSTASLQTYDFNIAAGTTIGSVSIYTQGVTGQDFADAGNSTCVAQTYAAATLCGVNLNFTALGSGTRMGAVVLYDAGGNPLATAFVSGKGLAPQAAFFPGTTTELGTQLSGPSGVAVDGNGDIYIADTGNNRVVEIPWTASGYGAQVQVPVTGLLNPMGLAVDGAGNLFVVSNGNDKTLKLPWTGSGFGPQSKVGDGFYGPSDVAVDGSGNVYVTDTLDNRVAKLPWTGTGYARTRYVGSYRRFPVGVAVDENGDVYFEMPYQNQLAEVPWDVNRFLLQTTVQQSGTSFASTIATDANSNLYILDTGNNRVVMLPWQGTGFGDQITVASGFNAPGGLAVDSRGNLYVADTGNNVVVKIDLSTPAQMAFASTYLGSTSADSAQSAVIENTGNQPLLFSALSYPADFPESQHSTQPCAEHGSVEPGGACTLSVDFTPTITGSPLVEAVGIATNSLNASGVTQALSVTGTSIGKQSQSIVFPAIPVTVYGAPSIVLAASASSGLPVTYQILSGPAVLSHRGMNLDIAGAGTVTLQASQSGNASYAAAPTVTIALRVAPATLTVTPANATCVYGTALSSLQYSITGFVLGEHPAKVLSGSAAITTTAKDNSGAGNYTLTASTGTLSSANYTFVFATGTLTITKATLQVHASSVSSTYGSALPAPAWTFTGFVNGDGASSVSGTPSMTVRPGAKLPVGAYPITPGAGTLASANYTFQFLAGTLTVTPAILTVTAPSQNMIYGGTVPALNYTIAGFAPGDTQATAIAGAAAIATQATSRSAAGAYAITLTRGSLEAGNYQFSFVSGSLLVAKAPLTITPVSATMHYGASMPALSYAVAGLVNGDKATAVLAGTPVLTAVVSTTTAPGNYAINAAPGSLTSANYSFTFASGTLTVTRAMLSVTPRPVSMTYGGQLPSYTYDIAGFVNGDGPHSIHGAPSFLTTATSASRVGSYPITGTAGTLASDRYGFKVVNGTLTVAKAVLTVSVDSQTILYGGPLPSLTYKISGFVNGDSQASALTGSPQMTTSAKARTGVGGYPISAVASSFVAANYSFQFGAGLLTINKANLTVIAGNVSMVAGSTIPPLTYSLVGLVSGDIPATAATGSPALTTDPKSKPGSYAVYIGRGSMTAGNYRLILVNGTLTVTPK